MSTTVTALAVTDPEALHTVMVMGMGVPFSG